MTTKIVIYKAILKPQHRLKFEVHNVYTEGIKKITRSSNDDKSLQTLDRIISYRYGVSTGKVCKTKLLECLHIR